MSQPKNPCPSSAAPPQGPTLRHRRSSMTQSSATAATQATNPSRPTSAATPHAPNLRHHRASVPLNSATTTAHAAKRTPPPTSTTGGSQATDPATDPAAPKAKGGQRSSVPKVPVRKEQTKRSRSAPKYAGDYIRRLHLYYLL